MWILSSLHAGCTQCWMSQLSHFSAVIACCSFFLWSDLTWMLPLHRLQFLPLITSNSFFPMFLSVWSGDRQGGDSAELATCKKKKTEQTKYTEFQSEKTVAHYGHRMFCHKKIAFLAQKRKQGYTDALFITFLKFLGFCGFPSCPIFVSCGSSPFSIMRVLSRNK